MRNCVIAQLRISKRLEKYLNPAWSSLSEEKHHYSGTLHARVRLSACNSCLFIPTTPGFSPWFFANRYFASYGDRLVNLLGFKPGTVQTSEQSLNLLLHTAGSEFTGHENGKRNGCEFQTFWKIANREQLDMFNVAETSGGMGKQEKGSILLR